MYNRLKSQRKKSPVKILKRHKVSRKKSPVKGWKQESPKKKSTRKKILKKCGDKCFLLPNSLKFPICPKNSCQISCKGLLAAKIRAKQWKYENVAKKAKKIYNKKCK